MDLTRKQVIEELQKMLDYCSIRQDITPERKQALVYAISSLKTDESYQIMYEGGEIFTKDDVLSMLYKLRSEIINMPKYFPYTDHTRWFIDGDDVLEPIDKKINALKGENQE